MVQRKMDKKKLDYYRNSLMKLKETFSKDILSMSENPKNSGEESHDISGHVLHMADVATDIYDKEFNLGLVSNEKGMLSKVDAALKKIDEKTFGICAECNKAIPEVRLKAIPYVETCLKCQEKLENEA